MNIIQYIFAEIQTVDIFAVGIIHYMLYTCGKHPVFRPGLSIEEYNNLIEEFNFEVEFPELMPE